MHTTKTLTMIKETNIFKLYDQIKFGKKGTALKFLADKCGVDTLYFKSNNLQFRSLPKRMNDSEKDEMITYLQNYIKLNN